MLIDDYIADTEGALASPDVVWADRCWQDKLMLAQQERYTLTALRRAQPFVLSPLTIETADSLAQYQAQKLREHAQYLHLPAYETWVDLSAARPAGAANGRRTGVLFVGDRESRNILSGEAVITTDFPGQGYAQLSGVFRLDRGLLWQPIAARSGVDQVEHYRQRGGDPDRLIATVWAAICLINTPRLSILNHVDLSRLNRARERSGKPPILSYQEVKIAIDRGETGPSVGMPSTEGRALHHVRAFLRLKKGRVELVRPHWRGDARMGVIKHRYVAFRAEDEAGPWKGPPLPAKRIIKELE